MIAEFLISTKWLISATGEWFRNLECLNTPGFCCGIGKRKISLSDVRAMYMFTAWQMYC